MEEMIEKAKEELKKLESLHPHQFNYIKLELQSFISLLQYSQQPPPPSPSPSPCSSSATTRASTSLNMKRKRKRKRDRVDVVLDRAQACLRKIQNFKNFTAS